ncbi:unnamed protein product [Protopolystoma xenopodis]|uniref:Uncharacterized protein n=1 Tax=Protopolystoma xenopodis TaxID=117903 RepID=A0A3S5A0S0_9PLAT|nr:unnamed protein product [Protopolystoma xenopodis]
MIFINYGSLDNLSLYTEYGFSLSCDVNPHDAAYPSYYELAHFAVSLPNGSAKIARLSWMLEQLDLSNPGTDSESCITMQILPDSKEPAKQVGFEDKDCFWSSVCFDSTGPSYFLNLLLYALTEEPLFVSTTCVKASSTSSNFVHLATKPKYVNDTPRSWLNSLDEEMIVRRTNHLAMKLANRLLQSVRCSQQNLSPGIISLVGKQTAAFVEADRSQHIARLRSHLEAQMRDGLTKWLEFREQLLLHSINSISTESKSHID